MPFLITEMNTDNNQHFVCVPPLISSSLPITGSIPRAVLATRGHDLLSTTLITAANAGCTWTFNPPSFQICLHPSDIRVFVRQLCVVKRKGSSKTKIFYHQLLSKRFCHMMMFIHIIKCLFTMCEWRAQTGFK